MIMTIILTIFVYWIALGTVVAIAMIGCLAVAHLLERIFTS